MRLFEQGSFFKSSAFNRCLRKLAVIGLIFGLVSVGSRAIAAEDPLAEKKIPAPVDVELETHDGLQLEATYYGSIVGKNAVPIIMLHAWKGSRADFAGLALNMQAKGFAVIVPDLRGHGKSVQIKRGGSLYTIDQATMHKADIEAMVTQDIEALKTFLMDRNNAGELNIEKLCVVGNEMGAVLALDWAVWDWHWKQFSTAKQGQDVKALVLISPPMNFHGLVITDALNRPEIQTGLSVLILVGDKNSKAMDDAKRINTRLGAFRPKPSSDPKEVEERQDLFLSLIKGASLQGPNILNDKTILPQLELVIGQFIDFRLVNKKFPWTDRKPALAP